MTDPHVVVVRQTECRDRADYVMVVDAYRLATVHPECAQLAAAADDQVCDTCGYALRREERYIAAVALVMCADRTGLAAVTEHHNLAAMHPRCERMHRAGRW